MNLIILDEYHLNPAIMSPALPKEAKIIYAWDKDYFAQQRYSLKQLVFIYETLIEISCEIVAASIDTVLTHYQSSEHHLFLSEFTASRVDYHHLMFNSMTHYQWTQLTTAPATFCKKFFPYWKKTRSALKQQYAQEK